MSGTGRRWAVATAVAGTIFIAAGAFWLSFTALADLADRSGIGSWQAWAWPLIVDGIIVVATVAVVALAGRQGSWYPWTLLIGGAAASVTANSLHAVVAADADVPGVLAAAVAAVPPIVLLAITHLTVLLTRTDTNEDPAQTGTPDGSSVATPAAAVTRAADATTTYRNEHRASVGVEDAQEINGSALPIAPQVGRRVRAAGLRASGWSNKKIARELDVHPSTVGRWFAAAHHSGEPEPASSGPVMEGTTP